MSLKQNDNFADTLMDFAEQKQINPKRVANHVSVFKEHTDGQNYGEVMADRCGHDSHQDMINDEIERDNARHDQQVFSGTDY